MSFSWTFSLSICQGLSWKEEKCRPPVDVNVTNRISRSNIRKGCYLSVLPHWSGDGGGPFQEINPQDREEQNGIILYCKDSISKPSAKKRLFDILFKRVWLSLKKHEK
ncbi:hypothetical protein CDAR_30661 [Caerostris darwini]|uniref:Uncharacterized protein n=1 Tax=Caerostris darwini TaxID=1538125 RepID=A0AAV4U4G1_9ARAC|nr:hypothetical protein CDAR_30661 [Caerostris darwini]